MITADELREALAALGEVDVDLDQLIEFADPEHTGRIVLDTLIRVMSE